MLDFEMIKTLQEMQLIHTLYLNKTKGRYCTLKFPVGQCQCAAVRMLCKETRKNSKF